MQANRLELNDVTLRLSRANSESRGDPFTLEVRDMTSGLTIGRFELDEVGIADLMSNRAAHARTTEVAVEVDYARVGRQRSNFTEQVPEDIKAKLPVEEAPREQYLALYAEERRKALGADTVRVDRAQRGLYLTFYSWAPREGQG